MGSVAGAESLHFRPDAGVLFVDEDRLDFGDLMDFRRGSRNRPDAKRRDATFPQYPEGVGGHDGLDYPATTAP